MTAHSSKGLEFKHVIITGMEENLFPSMNMISSLKDIEEERRLFYVALTRAKKDLVLSFASSRMRNGRTEFNALSRFVKEIDLEYFENPALILSQSGGFGGGFSTRVYAKQEPPRFEKKAPVQRPAPAPAQRPVDPDFKAVDMSELFVGERIEHNRFGPGRIKSITGVAPELKAVVDFDDFGEKTLLLKYAKMRPLK